jgi:hypothetical protein
MSLTARKSAHDKRSARDSVREGERECVRGRRAPGRYAAHVCRSRARRERRAGASCRAAAGSWRQASAHATPGRGRRSYQVLESWPRSQVRLRWTAMALRPVRVYGRIFQIAARLARAPVAVARIRGHGVMPRLLEGKDSSLDILKMHVGRLLAWPHLGVHSAFHDRPPHHS